MAAQTPRAMPNADLLLLDILRPALNGVTVVTTVPPDYLRRLPLAHVRTYPGNGQRIDNRFAFVAVAVVDAYAVDRLGAAGLAEQARLAVFGAQLNQGVFAHGVVNQIAVTSWPAEMPDPDQPSGLSRNHARYSLTIRP